VNASVPELVVMVHGQGERVAVARAGRSLAARCLELDFNCEVGVDRLMSESLLGSNDSIDTGSIAVASSDHAFEPTASGYSVQVGVAQLSLDVVDRQNHGNLSAVDPTAGRRLFSS